MLQGRILVQKYWLIEPVCRLADSQVKKPEAPDVFGAQGLSMF